VTPHLSAGTRLVALLGDPVAHSLSPHFQNAAFRAAGVDGVYLALRCGADALPGLLRGIAAAGGAGNVTVPHKAAAAGLVDRRTEAVVRTGACNTYWLEDGRVCGDNTDVAGVTAAMRQLLGGPVRGARVLLVGAGGAASAVIAALLAGGAERVVVLNRTAWRARELVARFEDDPALAVADDAAVRGDAFDLVVNATSLGLHASDDLPLAPDGLSPPTAALDLVYAPGGTRWSRLLRERGVRAEDGLEMLIQQGAAAFERWWPVPAPVAEMRRALARPAGP
jgi:shikimate dehydrogenase